MTLRIAVLVKQIPVATEMRMGADGRLQRAGLDTEMNAYCRRAVAKAVELAVEHGGDCTVLTLGPEPAEAVLREAIAWADARGAPMRGVHACDPAFAGSDTLATAVLLAALLRREGPFDLVLAGRCSLDADTGQVGPQVAELLNLPFATAIRDVALNTRSMTMRVRCEHDDGWLQADVALPAVMSTAERLTEPCKMGTQARENVRSDRIIRVAATDLGPGPWGAAASGTKVGDVKVHHVVRARRMLTGQPDELVTQLVSCLADRGALSEASRPDASAAAVPAPTTDPSGGPVAVLVEPGRERLTRELLGAAALLAAELNTRVAAIGPSLGAGAQLGSWGADAVISLVGSEIEEDIADGLTRWARRAQPVIVLAPSTAWGREVAGRTAAAHRAGLIGDAVGVELAGGRLVAWKPAFGGQLVAAITAATPMQMATVRAGALAVAAPREHTASMQSQAVRQRGGVQPRRRERDDDLDALAEARTVVGIGSAIGPADHERLTPLLTVLRAELAATRKVTDRGELPRARQIGITGRALAPRLYIALGISGKFNHLVGVQRAHTIVAINTDPDAPIFAAADIGLIADWREIVDGLVPALEATRAVR